MQTTDSTERKIEAILFASGEPMEAARLAEVLAIDDKTVQNLVERIRDRYRTQDSPLEILLLADGYQLCTRAEYADDIRVALAVRRNTPLSPAALEVLAIIAYNQPVTRSFIEQVRGVDCSSIVRGLQDKALVEEADRLNVPGRPIAYRTTTVFLRSFGLESLKQLPTLPTVPTVGALAPPLPAGAEEEQLEGQIDFYS